MYAHIEGTVADKGKDYLVIDCSGVGYLLQTSATTLSQAPAVGGRMKTYTFLSVREDALELFGFATREEKKMFERLKGVGGVGPKTALQILSAISLRDLSIALVTGDATALTRAPGIGKKTAQRLILELRDKVDNEALTGTATGASAGGAPAGAAAEAIEALMALGYQSAEAAKAVAKFEGQTERTDELIRLALKGMNV